LREDEASGFGQDLEGGYPKLMILTFDLKLPRGAEKEGLTSPEFSLRPKRVMIKNFIEE
jgi:hypothetical protein